ncbi:hypothetical protein DDB_G0285667 [Dictyostelium discoideum AX4]|uniref:ABC3 transporter permease C-terminal domain-containing protein n=1 Tax=Dictyostelium discoideum TaxID=44689 RepID=Q54MT8_DICDI|nr:hypothetical protein DDB_G0285667 [Dictyostelium discoideum AX4]EAL64671.1 hypothetical protein DDB_G0285667 [Dictyostelium discoideum AX4]|eukprot:XP_638205.1 hypothetical protein DDB_G0285667 [Dictyostelium discoideum AX4]
MHNFYGPSENDNCNEDEDGDDDDNSITKNYAILTSFDEDCDSNDYHFKKNNKFKIIIKGILYFFKLLTSIIIGALEFLKKEFKFFGLILKKIKINLKNIGFNTIIEEWFSIIKYSINGIKRSKLNYSIGFISCFLVVILVATGLSVLSNISLIFLSKADSDANHIDLIISGKQHQSIDLDKGFTIRLNYTLFDKILNNAILNFEKIENIEIKGENSAGASETIIQSSSSGGSKKKNFKNNSPRFHMIDTYGYPVNYCENIVENNIEARYFSNGSDLNCTESTCFINRCGGDGEHVYMGFQLLDFKKENDMGIKSTFGYGSQPKGTCLMVELLAKATELKIGDEIFIIVPAVELLSTLLTDSMISTTQIEKSPYIITKLKVNGFFNNTENPYELGFELGETIPSILIDIDSFYDSMVEQVNPSWNVDLMKNRNIKEYVEYIVMKFPSPRLSMYYGTDLDKTLQRVSEFTSKLIYKIGVGRVDISTPVMTELYKSNEVSSNLGQLLNLIVFVFLLLSILLIYTTLMIDVDSMTFNNGVFRMLGAKFSFIIELIVSKTIIFTVPSIILGLIISQIFLFIIIDQLKRFTNSDEISNYLTVDSIVYSILLGFLIPMVSLILPIRKALSFSLGEQLDTSRSNISSSHQITTIDKDSTDSEYRKFVSLIGLSLSALGIVGCFLLPKLLLSGNFSSLLALLFGLLILVLISAIFLMMNFHLIISKTLVYLITLIDPFAKNIIRIILYKNLISHKKKNKSTMFMFGVSVSLIIIINCLFLVQVEISNASNKQYFGSLLKIETSTFIKREDLSNITQCLDRIIDDENNGLDSYSLRSMEFSEFSQPDKKSIVSDLAKTKTLKSSLWAVGPTYFSELMEDYFQVSSVSKNLKTDKDVDFNQNGDMTDLSTILYSKDSMNKLILTQSQKKLMYLDEKGGPDEFLLSNYIEINNYTKIDPSGKNQQQNVTFNWIGRNVMKPLAYLKTAGTFSVSEIPDEDLTQSVITSFPAYVGLSGGNIDSVRNIPVSVILLKPKSLDDDLIDSLQYKISETCLFNKNSESPYIIRYKDSSNSSDKLNSLFFDFATVLSMIISSFSLISSMFTSIKNQSKEIGILRSIGLSNFKIYKIYIIEAFTLSFGSCIIGIIIGLFISYTILLEQSVMNQQIIPFSIQWELIPILFISSLIVSIISVFSPIRHLLKQPIITVLKD